MIIWTRAFVLFILGTLFASSAAELDDLPPELENWRDWVMHDTGFLGCPVRLHADPRIGSSRFCAWPGILEVVADASGGTFEIQWKVFDESWLPLPGGTRSWPLDVEIDGNAATVAVRGGQPYVIVGPGQYRVSGQFRWDQRPQVLRLPEAIAMVNLTVNGETIEAIARDSGNLWLGERRSDEAPEAASANLVIQRKITDGIPLQLTTRIGLNIAGPAREEILGQPLLDGFVVTAMSSQLPLRLDEENRLVAQVRPGFWEIVLVSRATRLPSQLSLSEPEGLWPGEEIWSFSANSLLRVAALEGVPAIDPQQAEVHDPWRHLPSYLVRPGDTVLLTERTRGMADDEGNRLSLQRRLWLDFDAEGYSVLDSLFGQMRQDWRVDLSDPLQMTSADSDQPLLVTTLESGRSGVEVRNPNVQLQIGARIEGDLRTLPVGGYDQPLEQVNVELNLPPGYRLVAATNVDRSPGSWINRWSLLDLFLVLITGAVFWRVFSPPIGLMAGTYLLLGYHESGSPVWSLLIAAACVGLLPLLSGLPERMLRFARNATLLTLAILAVPFVAGQLRMALHPQLERSYYDIGHSDLSAMPSPAVRAPQALAEAPQRVPSAPEQELKAKRASTSDSLERLEIAGSRIRPSDLISRYSPGALVQAGYGRPSWRWNAYQLSWAGPVLPEQSLRLIIAPPWLVSFLRVLVVALFAMLVAKLFASAIKPSALRRLALGSLVLLALPTMVVADSIPDETLRGELYSRLIEPPECSPDCGLIEKADIKADRTQLAIDLRIHAFEDIALALPQVGELWLWRSVTLDGQRIGWIHRDSNGVRWIHIGPGLHGLRIEGVLAPADSFSLQFPERPRDVTASVDDWEYSGLVNRQVPGGGISFVRVREEAATQETFSSQPLRTPEFVRVSRSISIGLDWEVQTLVQRVAPTEGSLTVSLPLWPGETVTSADFEVSDQRITVPFPPQAGNVVIRSRLDKQAQLRLSAGDEDHFVETWQIIVSPIWHMESTGLPLSMPQDSGNFWTFDFYPRRGESVDLDLVRPQAVSGETVAVDSMTLSIHAGRRAIDSELSLDIRASRGDQHALTLPTDARIDKVTINGNPPLNVRSEDGQLLIPLSPGSQNLNVDWQQTRDMGLVTRTPLIDLGARSSNLNINLTIPADRWILLTRGPRVGPAVLLWGEMLVMILLAWGLGRSTRTPLKFRHWLLLGIGFSTVSWLAFLVVIIWFFIMAWRGGEKATGPRWRFNLLQLVLTMVTLAALGTLVSTIPFGLLGQPDMHIVGNNSYGSTLRWFTDGSDGPIPSASVVSIPLWWYKGAMLAWALWLSSALLGWLPWVWKCLNADRFWLGKIKVKETIQDAPDTPEKQV